MTETFQKNNISFTRPCFVTWLNHYSLIHVPSKSLAIFDYIFIDGTFLQLYLRLLGHKVERTSADINLPDLLKNLNNIVLIGGKKNELFELKTKFSNIVKVIDGYEDLEEFRASEEAINFGNDTVIVLSLGPVLQEEVATEIHNLNCELTLFTAGGWIGQFGRKSHYYPKGVHKIRMGWLVRLFREPKRLWRRYSIDVIKFLIMANRKISALERDLNFRKNELGWKNARNC